MQIAKTQLFISIWVLLETIIGNLYAELFNTNEKINIAWGYTVEGNNGFLDLDANKLSDNQKYDLKKFKKYFKQCKNDSDKISIARIISELASSKYLQDESKKLFLKLNTIRIGIHNDFISTKPMHIEEKVLFGDLYLALKTLFSVIENQGYIFVFTGDKKLGFGIMGISHRLELNK